MAARLFLVHREPTLTQAKYLEQQVHGHESCLHKYMHCSFFPGSHAGEQVFGDALWFVPCQALCEQQRTALK